MKEVIILFLVLITSSCTHTRTEEERMNAVKEEMTTFFENTLMDNFGRKDNLSIKWLLEGITNYEYNYILAIDRKKLKEINDRCKDVLQEYVFDYKKMGDKFIMPEGWTRPELFNPYNPMVITEFRNDNPHTYWQKEVQPSENPLFKEAADSYRAIGGYAFTSMKGIINHNITENIVSVSDEEVLTFITFCFWEYLCYCANIDVVTGRDKTESIMEVSETI